jgi:hypothetical protein
MLNTKALFQGSSQSSLAAAFACRDTSWLNATLLLWAAVTTRASATLRCTAKMPRLPGEVGQNLTA